MRGPAASSTLSVPISTNNTKGKIGISTSTDSLSFADGTLVFDSKALLDIDGQIKIVDGNQWAGRTLHSLDDSGYVIWNTAIAPSITTLTAGTGIAFDPAGTITNTTNPNEVRVDFDVTQKRIYTGCGANEVAYSVTDNAGAGAKLDCRPAVTSINLSPSGGLFVSPTTGSVTIATYADTTNGLFTDSADSYKLKVKTPAGGSGLKLSAGQLQFETSGCSASNSYWAWNGSSWSCGAPSSVQKPGDGVMYLRVYSPLTPPDCPTGGGWVAVPTVGTEYVGGISFSNNVRTCYNTSNLCQVLELKAPTPTVAPGCPRATPSRDSITTIEQGNDSTSYRNNVRVCYPCVAP